VKTIALVLFLLAMAILVNFLYSPTYDEFKVQLETDLRHHQGKAIFYVGNIPVTPSFEEGVFIFRVPKKPMVYAGAGDSNKRRTWER